MLRELEAIAVAQGTIAFAAEPARFTPEPIAVAVGGTVNRIDVVLSQLAAQLGD